MAKKDSPRRDESDDSMGGDSYDGSNPIFMWNVNYASCM